jgi:iron-sulfur cluster assembly protein
MSTTENNHIQTAPLTFTGGAINEIKRLKTELNLPEDHALRVGVKGGGCSGMSYLLAFDSRAESDETFHMDGFDLIMNKAHGMYLVGMEVDYENGLNSRGFVFNNPNAKSTCGCGTSFSA